MMIQAYELFESYQGDTFREVILAFNRVVRQVCEGQQLDMDYEKIGDVSQAQYMEMIRLKTAVLNLAHNAAQLCVAYFLTGTSVAFYVPFLVLFGVLTGLLTGLVLKLTLKPLERLQNILK